MIIQVLEDYSQRTEYKVLQKFTSIQEIRIDNLAQGILLLPGILLGKLDKKDIKILRNWINMTSNQLIMTPAFIEYNIRDFFDTSIDIDIKKEEGLDYEGVQCDFKIISKAQERIFSNENGVFGIHYRKNTGSGLLTIITLPLLDYKLAHKHDEFKKYFIDCINKIEVEEREPQNKEFEVLEDHLQLLMFIAADCKSYEDLSKKFNIYFNKDYDDYYIRKLEEELEQMDLIQDKRVTDQGTELVKERRLKSFIRVLKGVKGSNEW